MDTFLFNVGSRFAYISDIGTDLMVEITDVAIVVDGDVHIRIYFHHLLPKPQHQIFAMSPKELYGNLTKVKAQQVN